MEKLCKPVANIQNSIDVELECANEELARTKAELAGISNASGLTNRRHI